MQIWLRNNQNAHTKTRITHSNKTFLVYSCQDRKQLHNGICHYRYLPNSIAQTYFSDARKSQITGIAAGGGAAILTGGTPVDQLRQAKRIQTYKILFHKLAKSLTSTFEKQVILEMNKMDEDGTRQVVSWICQLNTVLNM